MIATLGGRILVFRPGVEVRYLLTMGLLALERTPTSLGRRVTREHGTADDWLRHIASKKKIL